MTSLKNQIRLKVAEIAIKKKVASAEVAHLKDAFHKGLTSPITLLAAFAAGFGISASILRKPQTATPKQQSLQPAVEKAAVPQQQPAHKLNFEHVLAFMGFVVDVVLLAQRILK